MKKVLLLLFLVPFYAHAADNVAVTAGSGETVAFDDISSVKYQRVKPIFGVDGTNAGDVATSNPFPVQIRTSGGTEAIVNLGKAEDAAHSSGDLGAMCLTVRQDTAAALAGTDADYQPLITDSSGRLHVNVGNTVTVGSHAVTNAGTFAVQESGSALTALQTIDNPIVVDDAAFTPATTSVSMCGFEFDDSAPDSVNEGDAGAVRMSANRNMYTTLRDAAGNERGANVNASNQLSVSVDNTVTVASHAVTNAGTFVTQENGALLTSSQLIDDTVFAEDVASANADKGFQVLTRRTDTAAATAGTDGDYQPFITDSSGRLHVNVGNTVTVASHAVTNAGTFAVQVDGNALTSLQLIDDPVIADDAAFTPATSKTMVAGFEADETATDSVDEGDVGAARITLDRKLITTNYAHTAGGTSSYSFLSTAAVLAAQVKGSAGQVYDMDCFNKGSAAVYVRLYNQTGAPASTDTANIVWRGIVPGATTGGGFTKTFEVGREFTTGVGIRVSAAIADNDTTALNANEVVCNLGYK